MRPLSPAQRKLAHSLFQAKAARHRRLAALPIEEKIRILIDMQKLSNDIRRKTGRKPLPEWVRPPKHDQTVITFLRAVLPQIADRAAVLLRFSEDRGRSSALREPGRVSRGSRS